VTDWPISVYEEVRTPYHPISHPRRNRDQDTSPNGRDRADGSYGLVFPVSLTLCLILLLPRSVVPLASASAVYLLTSAYRGQSTANPRTYYVRDFVT